jgi:glucan 1,3-beta-glucosidase
LGLKIWIDLHGAPGSQNGFDNSGHKVATPGWQQGDTVRQTLDVLARISTKYAQPSYQDVIVAIELLNEPFIAELSFDITKQFYQDGFNLVRQTSDTPVIIQDGFLPPSTWNNFLDPWDHDAQYGKLSHFFCRIYITMAPKYFSAPASNGLSFLNFSRFSYMKQRLSTTTNTKFSTTI